MTKSHTTPDGDHRITLTPCGSWAVHLTIDAPDEFPLFEDRDFESCVQAVREVVEDALWGEHDPDDDWPQEALDLLAKFDLRHPYWTMRP